MNWWEIDPSDTYDAVPRPRAVAYYRHSAQDRQENSIPIQRDQVREWAEKNGVEIIHEFADEGTPGLIVGDRPAFNRLINDWVTTRDDFRYVLCLEVSRLSRCDGAAAICNKYGKQVIYTSSGTPVPNA